MNSSAHDIESSASASPALDHSCPSTPTTTTSAKQQELVSLSPKSSSHDPALPMTSAAAPRRLSSAASTALCCESKSKCCASTWGYGGISEAKGYALLAMGRGAMVMSNLVVNAAILELASAAAGCPNATELEQMEMEGIIDDANDYVCTGTVYGQNPLALVSNIAVVTGLLSAFFNPLIGVILDFTPHRKSVGILFSLLFWAIQGVQIGLGPDTWFPMAILMSIAGFCFSIIVMTTLAYLPEICEKVGQDEHSLYTARFTAKQFISSGVFLVAIGALSVAFGIDDDSVKTARMSQGLNVVVIAISFSMGWKLMPGRPASREPPEGMGGGCCGLLIHGMKQNFRTAVSIHRNYKKGLRWFLLAEMFSQSSVSSLTTVSVVYLSSELSLNATDIVYFFLCAMVGTVPGSKISNIVCKKTNPNASWALSMMYMLASVVIGAFTLGNTSNKYFALLWGFFVGIALGWYYPTENLFFSCILPKGQEAEIAGFRVYCSMVLAWLPPMIFSILIENGVDASWGMTFMGSLLLVAVIILVFGVGIGRWDEILEESGRSDLMNHDHNNNNAGAEQQHDEMNGNVEVASHHKD